MEALKYGSFVQRIFYFIEEINFRLSIQIMYLFTAPMHLDILLKNAQKSRAKANCVLSVSSVDCSLKSCAIGYHLTDQLSTAEKVENGVAIARYSAEVCVSATSG